MDLLREHYDISDDNTIEVGQVIDRLQMLQSLQVSEDASRRPDSTLLLGPHKVALLCPHVRLSVAHF